MNILLSIVQFNSKLQIELNWIIEHCISGGIKRSNKASKGLVMLIFDGILSLGFRKYLGKKGLNWTSSKGLTSSIMFFKPSFVNRAISSTFTFFFVFLSLPVSSFSSIFSSSVCVYNCWIGSEVESLVEDLVEGSVEVEAGNRSIQFNQFWASNWIELS